MPTPEDGHFVGAMPPQLFLKQFMKTKGRLPTVPSVDFTSISGAETVQEMCSLFIKAATESGICPDMQLYQAKTTRRREGEDNLDSYYEPRYDSEGNILEMPLPTIRHRACPAIGVRKRPTMERTRKTRSASKKKASDGVFYYNFSTNLLDIEVVPDVDADPFEDPPEAVSSRAPSGRLHSSASPRSSASEKAHSPKSRFPLSPIQSTPVSSPKSSTPGGAKPCTPKFDASESPASPPLQEAGPSLPPKVISGSSSYWTSFERNTIEAEIFRARLVGHVKAEFARQHRLFIFQIILVNRFARFIRWDHSGAVVTERFDYIENSALLAEFLWKFNYMTEEQRGFDPNVRLAASTEKKQFEQAVTTFLGDMNAETKPKALVRKLPGADLTLDESKTYPTWKVHVVDSTTRKATNLVIRRPFSENSSLWGRSTRAYVAYDLTEGRLFCLKDTWRLDDSDILPEADTFYELMHHAVSHIPGLMYGGDVCSSDRRLQETSSQACATDGGEWRATAPSLDKHVHHRLVQEIAYPLENAVDEMEFIQIFQDVLCAIKEAYDTAGLLHRDVSYRNIMMTHDGRGILNDWDHAGRRDDLACGIGTWSSMSIALLQNPDKYHDLVDDLESHFWVLTSGALKQFSQPGQWYDEEMFDEEYRDGRGHLVGGTKKLTALFGGWIHKRKYTCPALQNLMFSCAGSWIKYHAAARETSPLDEDTESKSKHLLSSVSQPSFWIEKFATALDQFHSCCARHASSRNNHEATGSTLPATTQESNVRAGKKRNADDARDNEIAADVGYHLRRSKRLKQQT